LTGQGRFTTDRRPDRAAHTVVLRSPHAHAAIAAIDRAQAAAMPGVLAVLTGADVLADGLGPIPCVSRPRTADGRLQAIIEPPYLALAIDRVRFVGDAVAVVVAETVAQARDAAEHIPSRKSRQCSLVCRARKLRVREGFQCDFSMRLHKSRHLSDP